MRRSLLASIFALGLLLAAPMAHAPQEALLDSNGKENVRGTSMPGAITENNQEYDWEHWSRRDLP